MSTLAKPRTKSAAAGSNGQGNGHAGLPTRRIHKRAIEAVNLAPSSIVPSPFQPRKDFPQEEIAELAETIASLGQLQPVLVRQVGDHYELVDGERRWRAVKSLGYDSIRAEVHDFTDAEARAIVLVSALQRKELNAIEEARAFRAAIDAGDVPGPSELARRLGVSQGHVSNRLRLLELPESVQKKVISREIPPTHARSLLPLKEHPKVIEAVVKAAIDPKADEPPTLEEFRRDVYYAAEEKFREVNSRRYDRSRGRSIEPWNPTDEERAQLGIITLEGWAGKAVEFATNTKLFDQIENEREKKREERVAKRAAKNQGASKGKDTAKLTPVERKRAEEEEARRKEEQAKQFAKRLYEWKISWLAYLIADELPRASEGELLRLLPLLAAEWCGSASDMGEWLAAAIEAAGGTVKKRKHGYGHDLFAAAAEVLAPENVAAEFVAKCFWDTNRGPSNVVPAEDVEAVAEHLGIDLAERWADEQAGPLSEAFWNLHTKEQLQELAAELKVELPAGAKKAEAVQLFLARLPSPDDSASEDAQKWLTLPREIKKAKRPK